MKGYEFPYDGFKMGLRPFENSPRNNQYATELFNLCPAEAGIEGHEQIIDIATEYSWGGLGVYTPTSKTRDIVIRVTDYIDSEEISGVTVFVDNVNKGTTNASGELAVTGLSVGGHEIKLTLAGYYDSDADTLFNDYIFVI